MFANNEVVMISWQHCEETRVSTLKHSNKLIASNVTAGAKMHFYSSLDKLQDKALHCDNDSVVYIQPRNEPGLVETVDCLGAKISEFKSCEYICE